MDTAMDIPFTQFLMPDGRETPNPFACKDAEIYRVAMLVIQDPRYRFECEMLTNGMISITCADRHKGKDIAHEVCSNGPPVVDAVHKVVRAAHAKIFPPQGAGAPAHH